MKAIIIVVFTGIMLSFGFIYMMSKFAKEMAYCALAMLLLILFGGGAIMVLSGLSGGATDGPSVGSGL